ncbi:hypothetical protein VNO77_17893 [Canavalia gladiata]|uniref:t-SNARE coiled-coil homology domain-containing protein n=1 Tax=Canavalia gladiata TaxID=3824 RepID=A0AAN9LNL8_CANGL
MNDLLSSLFRKEHVIEETAEGGKNVVEKFLEEVESVKEELKELEQLHLSLRATNQHGKTLHSPKAVKNLRSRMDLDVALSLTKAKLVKARLEALDSSNRAARSMPDCGPGSYSDRTRTALVSGLRKNLKDSMESFNNLREQISYEYRDTVQRRYYAVTGENPDPETIDLLISTGESETFLQKAIQQQGRASIMGTIQEIEERHGTVKEIERSLNELHQVFLDMSVLVQSQGEELDDIEKQVAVADSFVSKGIEQLQVVRDHQKKNTRKCTCFAILLFIIILVVALPIKEKEKRTEKKGYPRDDFVHVDKEVPNSTGPCRDIKRVLDSFTRSLLIPIQSGMAGIRMIDIAVNFTDGMFKGIYNGKQCHMSDIPTVLTRAWAAGVHRIIVTGGSLEESREALAIAETDGRLFCTVGVHPTRCKEFEESGDPEKHFQALLSLAKEGIQKGKVVAIGECGLDYDRLHFCPAEIQKKYFEKQFELSYITKLPMFLHMRAAAADFCEIVEKNQDRFTGGVTHSFTGSVDDCIKLLSFDKMYIGINGCSLKTNENLAVVKDIPIERMMIETDSPYCEIKNTHAGIGFVKSKWPSKKKEKYDQESIVKGRNEPCLVRQVLEVVAGCKGINDVANLSQTLYHNTCRVFFPHDMDSAADALLDGGNSS